MSDKPYTDTEVAQLTAHVRVAIGWPVSAGEAGTIARAVLDALAADGRWPADHHQPLLALTADEVKALLTAAHLMADKFCDRDLRSALDKTS